MSALRWYLALFTTAVRDAAIAGTALAAVVYGFLALMHRSTNPVGILDGWYLHLTAAMCAGACLLPCLLLAASRRRRADRRAEVARYVEWARQAWPTLSPTDRALVRGRLEALGAAGAVPAGPYAVVPSAYVPYAAANDLPPFDAGG
jgi:hypothetical protein